jgi:hypothetical protein
MFSAFAFDFERGQWQVGQGGGVAGAPRGRRTRRLIVARMTARLLKGGMLALLLGACSADLSLNSVTFKPETVFNPSGWTTLSVPLKNDPDLLNAEGQCSAAGSDQKAVPLGIALHMTECEVVRLAGPVEKFEFGSDGRGQRLLLLTYLQGPHAGIYRFSGGRLVVIERSPSPAEASPPNRGLAKKRAAFDKQSAGKG